MTIEPGLELWRKRVELFAALQSVQNCDVNCMRAAHTRPPIHNPMEWCVSDGYDAMQ